MTIAEREKLGDIFIIIAEMEAHAHENLNFLFDPAT